MEGRSVDGVECRCARGWERCGLSGYSGGLSCMCPGRRGFKLRLGWLQRGLDNVGGGASYNVDSHKV